jgi:hypothetical protein
LDGEPPTPKKDANGAKGSTAPNGGTTAQGGGVTGGSYFCAGCGANGEDTYGIPGDGSTAGSNQPPSPQMPPATSTYGTSMPGQTNDLGFDVQSFGADASAAGGLSSSIKEYRTGYNPKKLWSDKMMRTYETDAVTGFGANIGADYGIGQFNGVKPFENPFKRIINASDADIGLGFEFARGGYNTGDGTYSYKSFGVGISIGVKGLDAIKQGASPLLTNNPASISTGIHDPLILYMDVPSFKDSIRTSLNNRGDSTAEEFLKRNPSVIPKCLTCK